MKILLVADEPSKALWDFYDAQRTEGVDLILSAGDLSASYLEFLVTMVNCPLLYVRGNHDDIFSIYPPDGCTCIEDTIYKFKGIRIMGIGGSMRYRDGKNMFTEDQMRKRVRKMDLAAMRTHGFDILLTHAPAKGHGDLQDLPHIGFECFNELLEKWKPQYMIHGHVHQSYGHFTREQMHPSGAKIINAFGYTMLELPDPVEEVEQVSRLASIRLTLKSKFRKA